MEKELWFTREEYVGRVRKVQAALRERRLDMLLAFHPESVAYLTGFFTNGFFLLQFAIIPAQGDPIVVCRDIEEYYLDRRGVFTPRVLWSDGQDTNQAAVNAIKQAGGASASIGLELSAWQLNARLYDALKSGLPAARFVDASTLVAEFRWIKSEAELEYQRQAGRVAEVGMRVGVEVAKAGATERDVSAEVASAMIRAGNDGADPGGVASGERAFHVHGSHSDRVLELGDTVFLEVQPHVRRYHSRFMRSIKVGRASREEHGLARQLLAIQDRALAEVRAGVSATVPDRVYRDGIRATGLVDRYTYRTFYAVGFMIDPSGESRRAAPGWDTWTFLSGMTFHTYLMVRDLAFSETILVTDNGYERLTNYSRELLVS